MCEYLRLQVFTPSRLRHASRDITGKVHGNAPMHERQEVLSYGTSHYG